MSLGSMITSCCSYLPDNIVTNEDISKTVETSDEWIFSRTGIKERRIADKDETTSSMAYDASLKLLKDLDFDPKDIDMIIVATTTPDYTFPSVACILQSKLKCRDVPAFDISAACSGFLYGLYISNQFILSGAAKNILLVGADKMSSITDWKDRNTCVLFGDGAGAMLIEAKKINNPLDFTESRMIDFDMHSNGDFIDILRTSDGVTTTNKSGFIQMNGKEVFRNAIENTVISTRSVIERNDLSCNDIDLVIPHQANRRIIEAVMERLEMPIEKAIIFVKEHGNTSAASIPLCFAGAIKSEKIKRGDKVVMHAVGSGLTWGSCLFVY